MLKSLLNAFNKNKASATVTQERAIVDIYGRPVEDALEYFYPKQIKGIPVFSVDSIYDHYYESKIKDIIEHCGIGDHREHEGKQVREILYAEVIKRYIEYVHMIPASEDQHHSTPGGMIVHSLEASRWAQKWAKSKTPPSTGMHDLDRRSRPAYKYAAWLATLMHDAGKVLRDIVIDAVDIEVDGKNERVSRDRPVPTWRPQKESLVDWAKRFHVATYSVTYIEREHNRHNIDSIQLLNPVLGTGYALNYLLDSPADVHGSLVRLLSGHDNRLDYITSAKQYGDQMSSARNMGLSDNSAYLVDKKISTHGRIIRAMRIARTTWNFNVTGAHAWIIGGEVYLRYQKAFHSIINTAKKHELNIPGAVETVLNIMEDNHIIQSYSDEYKSILFTPGTFTKEELLEIITGQRNAIWEEIIRVKWKGYVFNDDPAPDSMSGVYTIPSHEKFYQIDERGIVHELNRDELVALSTPVNDSDDGNTYADEDLAPSTPVQQTPQPTSEEDVSTSPTQVDNTSVANGQAGELPHTNTTAPPQQTEAPDTDKKATSAQNKKASPKQDAIKKAIEEAKKNKKPKPKMEFKNAPSEAPMSTTDTKQEAEGKTDTQPGAPSKGAPRKETHSATDKKVSAQKAVPGKEEASSKDESKEASNNATKAERGRKQNTPERQDTSARDNHLHAEEKSAESTNKGKSNSAVIRDKKKQASSTDSETPFPAIKLDRVKRHKIPRHASTFVCIDDVVKENNLASRADAINVMRQQGLAEESKGNALVVAHRLNGKLVQMVGVNDEQAQSNQMSDSKPASSKDTKTTGAQPRSNGNPPSLNDKNKPEPSRRPESREKQEEKSIDWEAVFASDSASIHGLQIKIKNAPKGTLGAYLRGLSDSLEEGKSLSTVAVEYKSKAAIKTIPLLNYINTQRSSPIRYRHIKGAILKAGEQVESEKVGIESIVVINGQSINKIQIEE
tara:strand:+ start:4573 stop:7440 length:2868 start_codon:yes stop_codon:yes gene_type:complete